MQESSQKEVKITITFLLCLLGSQNLESNHNVHWYLGFPASTTNKNRVIKAQRDHHYVFNAQILTRTINIQKFNHSKEFYIIFLTLRPVDLLMVEPIRLPEEDHWARKIT